MDKHNVFKKIWKVTVDEVKTDIDSSYSYLGGIYKTYQDYIPSPEYLVLIFGTLAIMAILGILKNIQVEKRKKILQQIQEEENPGSRQEVSIARYEPICEKITEEEFEFQSRVITRQEIRTLVSSKKYSELVATKGTQDIGKWNWQVAEKQEGYFPKLDEELKQGNEHSQVTFEEKLQLEQQLIQVDQELRDIGVEQLKKAIGWGIQTRSKLASSISTPIKLNEQMNYTN